MAWGYQKLGTQEAANDMYVTDVVHRERTESSELSSKQGGFSELYARPTDDTPYRGGGTQMDTVVRRLTPEECEALQGFPRNWTNIGDWTDSKGKVRKTTDSARYKALGNSIAVGYTNNQSGFWMWLMKRISAEYERSATLGSLFSGIGGFELAHVRYNGSDSVLWSSEIEEFPIAVLKKHFGDEDAGLKGDIQQYL